MTETNETPCASNSSTSLAKSARDRVTITSRSLSKQNPDAALLEMIRRHDDLWQQWTEEPPTELVHEACRLEVKITATPAFTRQGFAGKRRVVLRAAFDDDDGIVAAIIENDAARVRVRKRRPHATAGEIATA